jgi:glycosyltransferase involved in cell wall biosynthesis
MKLTILSQYYPPETGAPQNRLSDLARRLSSYGHQVEVLTALPNYPGDAIFPEYIGRGNMVEFLDGIRIVRISLYVPKVKSFARRMGNYLSFTVNAKIRGPKFLSRTDLLFMESPPLFLALAGVPMARKLGGKLVCNVSDLWPKSVIELGIMKSGLAYKAAERLELWMYENSAMITGQTEGILEEIKNRVPGKRVEIFPNGIDVREYSGLLDREGRRREFGWGDGLFVIGYTGVLGHAQALDQVLDAAKRLTDIPELHFAFFGDGPRKDHLEKRISGERIESCRVYPRQPREGIPHLQAAMDAGIVPLAKGKLFEGARPSKMFEIMAAGRPVILCAKGEAERIIMNSPGGAAGLCVPPEEPEELASSIRRICSEKKRGEQMGCRGREHAFANFDREQIGKRMERLFLEVMNSR